MDKQERIQWLKDKIAELESLYFSTEGVNVTGHATSISQDGMGITTDGKQRLKNQLDELRQELKSLQGGFMKTCNISRAFNG